MISYYTINIYKYIINTNKFNELQNHGIEKFKTLSKLNGNGIFIAELYSYKYKLNFCEYKFPVNGVC